MGCSDADDFRDKVIYPEPTKSLTIKLTRINVYWYIVYTTDWCTPPAAMMKVKISTSTTGRLFPSASDLHRRLFTAAAVGVETSVAATEDASSARTSATKPDGMRLLCQRVFSLGSSRGKVSDVLHPFIKDGHRVGKTGLISCLKELRKFKRHHRCLEIFEWMDKGKYKYNDKDHALRIDIICKTKGAEEAEKYFEGLPAEAKNLLTYGSLLNCYCTEKLVDKAAALFEEMDKLSYLTSLAFNNMMMLALLTGEPEKVPGVVEQMESREFPLNSHSYSLLIQSYKLLNDMEGIEKVTEKIDKDGENRNWVVYSNLAATYIRAGDFEKAETALKRLEESSKSLSGSDPLHYHYLISFYATMGNLAEVNRIWDSLRSDFHPTGNLSYLVMLQNLTKLGQTDQVQACFEEWKAGCRRFDLRIATVAMGSCLGQNQIEEAKQIFDDAVEKTGLPFFRGRELFIAHFLGKREIDLALKHLREAIGLVKERDKWYPNTEKTSAFWKYFEEEKDVDGAEEFSELLRKVKCLDSTAYLSLLGTYAAAGKTAPQMRDRMKQDGIEINHDHEILLEKVCPE